MKTKNIRFVLWFLVLLAGTHVTLVKIIGTSTSMLTGIACIFPVLGALLPLSLVSGSIFSCLALKFLIKGLPFTLGLPTIFATLAWTCSTNATRNLYAKIGDLFFHLVLPAMCMTIFMLHPLSQTAWPYALYWLIPPALWILRTYANINCVFFAALASSFIAHATGSILWVFFRPLPAAQWLALIPVVAMERLALAICATATYYGIIKITTLATKTKKDKQAHTKHYNM